MSRRHRNRQRVQNNPANQGKRREKKKGWMQQFLGRIGDVIDHREPRFRPNGPFADSIHDHIARTEDANPPA